MQKTITKILMLFIVGFLILGCDKKEEEITPANQMNYDDKTYDLIQGIGHSEEHQDKGIEEFNLFLLTASFKVQSKDGRVENYSGTLTGIFLSISMKKGMKGLDSGEYVCDSKVQGTPNTFYGGVVLEADPDGPSNFENYLKLGKVTVKKNNNSYEITFDCTDGDGKTVKGFYKGELISFE